MNTNNFQKAIVNLNKEQKKAVEQIYGPVMVVAGPGTGKTQILALRIAYILQNTDALPGNILCLTFTEAGAHAMRERLKSFIGTDAYSVGIFTFHGFANTVIQEFPEHFAFSKDLIQLDDVTRLKIIREAIDESENLDKLRPFHNKYAKEREIISAIQTLKKEGIDFNELNTRREKLINEHNENIKLNRQGKPTVEWQKRLEKLESIIELVEVYKTYQEKLLVNGLYDYEDMILFVGEGLSENDTLRQYYQEKYQFIHVDEYQDTNGGQNEILRQLGSFDESPNIFVVGDDDQAIYRFQGANLENILSFNTSFKNAKTIAITTNYRSTQTILDLASSVIKNNVQRLSNRIEKLEKNLSAFFKGDDTKAELHEFETIEDEYIFISKEIKSLIASGTDPKDIAIIYRKNVHGEELNEVLNKNEISTNHASSNNILNNELIKQLINILTTVSLYDKNVNPDLYRVMLYPYFNIPVIDVYELLSDLKKKDISLALSVLNMEDPETPIGRFSELLKKWHIDSVNKTLSQLFINIINESGLLNYAADSETESEFSDILSLISFYEFVKNYERVNKNTTLSNFLSDIELMQENKYAVTSTKIEKDDGVNLLTAHSSKGLEFKYVFIVHTTETNWGSTRKMSSLLVPEIYTDFYDANEDKALRLEDERRLFFVAITRAKDKLYFTKSNVEQTEGKPSKTNLSQFIEELDHTKIKHFDIQDHEFSKEEVITILKKPIEEDYSKEEQTFLRDKIERFSLSATALNDYIESPLKFKEKHLIRIPRAKNKAEAMGTSIHACMEYLNKALIKDSNLSRIKVETLEKIYSQTLKREFEGEEEFEETLKEGKSILEKYFNFYIKTEKYPLPVEAEYNFGFNHVMLELEPDDEIRISGKIDKVEVIDEKNNLVKIVDYKTSKPKSENQIKGNTKNSDARYWRQLVFYKLLCEQDPNFRSKTKYNTAKYLCDEVEIDFLKEDKGKFIKRSFKVTDEDIRKLKELIKEVMKNIRELNFPEEPIIDLSQY